MWQLLLAAVVLLTACTTTTNIGTAVKVGAINKTGVELAFSEVIRLDCAAHSPKGAVPGCVKRISEADWKTASAAYGNYEAIQKSYADALIAWTRVKSAENDQRLDAIGDQLKTQATNAARVLCSFKHLNADLAKVCTGMGV